MKSIDCPSGVNKKVFYSICRRQFFPIIQIGSIFLVSSGDDLPTPQTAAVLLALYSQLAIKLPELLSSENPTASISNKSYVTQKQLQLYLSTVCEIACTAYASSQNPLTLLSRSIRSLTTSLSRHITATDGASARSSEHQTSTILTDTALVRWQKNLNAALNKIGVSTGTLDPMVVEESKGSHGFAALARKSHRLEASEGKKEFSDEEEESVTDETNNLLVELKNKDHTSVEEIQYYIEKQIVEIFMKTWNILNRNDEDIDERIDENDSKINDEQFDSSAIQGFQNMEQNNEGLDEKEMIHVDLDKTSEELANMESTDNQIDCQDESQSFSGDQLSILDSTTLSCSQFESNKRRKLSAQGDYAVIHCNRSPQQEDSSPQSSTTNSSASSQSNFTVNFVNSTPIDPRVSLVPIISAFMGLPVDQSIAPPTTSSLHLAFNQLHQFTSSTTSAHSHPRVRDSFQIVSNSPLVHQWIALAAKLTSKNPFASSFLLNNILTFAQQLTRLQSSHPDPTFKKQISETCSLLLQSINTHFIDDQNSLSILTSSKDVQRLLVLLVTELALSAPSLHQYVLNDKWFSLLLGSPKLIKEDIVSLFLDLVMSSSSVSVSQRAAFVKSVLAFAPSNQFILKCCQVHSSRIRSDVEIELNRVLSPCGERVMPPNTVFQ